MIFDERSHPKMCHAMWGCLRAHTHLICQQNLRRRLWSKGGWDFFNSAQPPVKDQSVWINDYSSTIAPLEDYFPKLLGVSRSQKYHFRVGISQTPAGDRRGSAELLQVAYATGGRDFPALGDGFRSDHQCWGIPAVAGELSSFSDSSDCLCNISNLPLMRLKCEHP